MRDEYLPFGKPNFSGEEIAAVSRVLRSGWVGMGPETLEFEKELGAFVRAPQVVTTNSCTSALFLSLLFHGVCPGDEVICPSLTWCSTANAALHLGARPVFCDVDPDTLCLSAETITAKLSPRTKAVMMVHLGGLAIDPDPIRAALPARVAIVEDAAHALGARYPNGRPVGSSGNLTCFSFYANKNLSTGEGGAVALSDEATAARLRSLRQNAMPSDAWKRYSHSKSLLSFALADLGYKMNYTDLQAAIGRIQLRRQQEFRARRMKIAAHYHENLPPMIAGLRFQHNLHDADHARHLYLILLPRAGFPVSRDRLLLALRHRNIGASIHYPPLHRMPLYGGAAQPALPETESIAARILTLPISASMSLADADAVVVQTEQSLRAEERVVV
jgi:dTDP-4-amino-4,6-dideoxygalactose transaminase